MTPEGAEELEAALEKDPIEFGIHRFRWDGILMKGYFYHKFQKIMKTQLTYSANPLREKRRSRRQKDYFKTHAKSVLSGEKRIKAIVYRNRIV